MINDMISKLEKKAAEEADQQELKKKLANTIFGYLATCEGKFCTTTLQNQNFGFKLVENAEALPKFEISIFSNLILILY